MILKYLERKQKRRETEMYGVHFRQMLELYADSSVKLGAARSCQEMHATEMLFRYRAAVCALILNGEDATAAEEVKDKIEREFERRQQWMEAVERRAFQWGDPDYDGEKYDG